ncbi:hypothetical protein ACFOFO_05885 [Undibacterium arcticum]|uniref:Glyceraldehyde-3-phosphate dehydrogenase n=1 Tax=Undibacterium arcticum TaxID=1762892 RepID=A0ABV7F1C7_9BURK
MAIKVAINGYGRILRNVCNVLRAHHEGVNTAGGTNRIVRIGEKFDA